MSTDEGRRRIVLIDDHPIVLEGLATLVCQEPGLMLVGTASSALAGLKLIRDLAPDVAVVDVSMPDLNGIALARRVNEEALPVSIILLTLHESSAYMKQALQAGVRGYVLKQSATETLVAAIQGVLAGGFYLDAKLAKSAIGKRVGAQSNLYRARRGTVSEGVTERETEVLKLAALGHTNKEIAIKLEIGVKSVETYKARASEKLGLRSRAEIVRYAAGEGWLADL